MGTGTAEEQSFDRRLIPSESEQWPHREELIERQFSVEDLSAGEAPSAFEIERRQRLPLDDQRAKIRCVLHQRLHDGVAERVAPIVPGDRLPVSCCRLLSEVVRRKL